MIGKLKGLIDSYGEDHVIIDVQGVGYVVQCSSRTLQRLPQPGEAAALSIETHVREDAIRLYGFMSDVERDWFRLMQVVQGVGAKVALATNVTGDEAGLRSPGGSHAMVCAAFAAKLACRNFARSIVTTAVLAVPPASPLQPLKRCVASGVAATVTIEPTA